MIWLYVIAAFVGGIGVGWLVFRKRVRAIPTEGANVPSLRDRVMRLEEGYPFQVLSPHPTDPKKWVRVYKGHDLTRAKEERLHVRNQGGEAFLFVHGENRG